MRAPQRANENPALAGLEDVLGRGLGSSETSVAPADNYLERVAKYVPAEVLA